MTTWVVTEDGLYLGGFDGAEPPKGAIEVPEPPVDARQTWDGRAWSEVSLLPGEKSEWDLVKEELAALKSKVEVLETKEVAPGGKLA